MIRSHACRTFSRSSRANCTLMLPFLWHCCPDHSQLDHFPPYPSTCSTILLPPGSGRRRPLDAIGRPAGFRRAGASYRHHTITWICATRRHLLIGVHRVARALSYAPHLAPPTAHLVHSPAALLLPRVRLFSFLPRECAVTLRGLSRSSAQGSTMPFRGWALRGYPVATLAAPPTLGHISLSSFLATPSGTSLCLSVRPCVYLPHAFAPRRPRSTRLSPYAAPFLPPPAAGAAERSAGRGRLGRGDEPDRRRQPGTADRDGPGSHGFYTSGQLFLEEYYALGILAKAGIGTPHLDGNTRLCTATAAASLKESFGADGQPGRMRTSMNARRCSATGTTWPKPKRCCGRASWTAWPVRTGRHSFALIPGTRPSLVRPTSTSAFDPGRTSR